MKLKNLTSLLALTALATLNSHLSTGFAQGTLTPPGGAPAPVMKSLDQIEARTPVNTLAGDGTASHIITLPGSYYLTGAINGNSGKSGIRIEADNVTLDLNGFTLEAVGGSLAGIQINLSAGQVNIRNGQLRFWPSGGILSTQAVNCLIENIAIRSVSGPGIKLGGPSTLRGVIVNGAVGFGINARGSLISDCVVGNVVAQQAGTQTAGVLSEGGIVLSTTVTNITSVGGLTRGIGAGTVRDCTVERVETASGAASGISAVVMDNTGSTVWTGSAENCRVRNVTAPSLASGIYYFGTIRGCSVNGVTAVTTSGWSMGISGHAVHESQVTETKSAGVYANGISANSSIGCLVQMVKNTGTGFAIGILTDDGTGNSRGGVVRDCIVRGADDYGIYAIEGAVVSGCSVTSLVSPYAHVATGFYAYGSGNIFEGNSATYCTTGFNVGSGNLTKGNTAASNTTDYGAAWANVIVTSVSTATNAFSNLSY